MSETLEIQVNGEPFEVPKGSTVADLVASRDLRPELVAVERNREIVPRKEHEAVPIESGDRIEIVTLVGGG